MSSVVKRIKEYIDSKGITVAAFERSIGVSNATFGKSLKSGGNLGSDKIEKMLSIYPDLNSEWLMTGRGSMIYLDARPGISYDYGPDGGQMMGEPGLRFKTPEDEVAYLKNRLHMCQEIINDKSEMLCDKEEIIRHLRRQIAELKGESPEYVVTSVHQPE